MANANIVRPPGPKRKPLWGLMWEFRREPLAFLHRVASFGDIAFFPFGPQDLYLVNHPDYIKEVLVNHPRNFIKSRALQRAKSLLGEGLLTAEGDAHKRQRRMAQPAFHRQRIAHYAQSMVQYADNLQASWLNGTTLDISQEMMRLTLSIVAKTLFDAELSTQANELGQAMGKFVEAFKMLTLPFSEILEKLPLPSMRATNKARELLNQTIYRIIAERRAHPNDRGDLLSMLLMAVDEEGQGLSDLLVRDELMTLFIAGHETTATALTWTWCLLAQHPEVEAKFWQELTTVLAGRLPTAEDFPQLRYTEMIVAESMRLYPPAWIMGRKVVQELEIGGYTIPVDNVVLLSPYLMHHDERYFPEPFKFDPERWQPEARESRPKHAYFPFGGGPRQCIGEPFAWMEAVLLLATIGQKWQLRLAPGHQVVPQPLITLRSKGGMPMTLVKRDA